MMAAHEHDLEELNEKLDADKNRQLLTLRDRLSNRRRRKMDEMRRKQEVELTKEMLEQKKDIDDVRLKKVHNNAYSLKKNIVKF